MEHMDTELARGFLSGALHAVTQAHWETHLRTCRPCRELVRRERAWAGLVKLDREPPTLDGAVERLLARIAPPGQRRSRLRQFMPAAALAAALGIVLGLACRLIVTPSAVRRAGVEWDVPAALQRDVMASLDTLQVLKHDPWLADNYEAVRWLEKLILGAEGG